MGNPSARSIEVFLIVSQSDFKLFFLSHPRESLGNPSARAIEVFLIVSQSVSDKSTSDVMDNVDVDYAAGSFCLSCSIPPPMAGGLGVGG